MTSRADNFFLRIIAASSVALIKQISVCGLERVSESRKADSTSRGAAKLRSIFAADVNIPAAHRDAKKTLKSAPLLGIRQSKNVKRIAGLRRMNVWQNRSRHIARAAAAEPCGDGNILFAADAECHW